MPEGAFTAVARRSSGWWAIEVTGDDLSYPAYTQARRLDQAEATVRDLLAHCFDLRPDQIGTLELVPVLEPPLGEEISNTRQVRENAERLRVDAVYMTRQTARRLKARGLPQRDISILLGISHQAVSQILAS